MQLQWSLFAFAMTSTHTQELDICAGGGYKRTSLQLAARDNTPEVAIRSLECTATNLDAVDEHGRTALMTASLKGSFKVVKVLLAAGADLEPRDCDSKNALNLAASDAIRAIVQKEQSKRDALFNFLMSGDVESSHTEAKRDSGLADLLAAASKKNASSSSRECPF